jgi:hypothetical protein
MKQFHESTFNTNILRKDMSKEEIEQSIKKEK